MAKNKTQKLLKKLDVISTEKKHEVYQEKQKKLWVITIKALKEHRILSPKDLQEIARLEIF